MEDPDLPEQHHRDPATLPLTDVSPKLNEQCLDITPRDIGPNRMGKDGFQGLRCVRLMAKMVLL